MRRSVPHIIEYKHSETSRFCIDTRENEKRVRRFFATKTAAQNELKRIRLKIRQEGEEALGLSDATRVAALNGEKALAPFGKTIGDAIQYYLKHLEDSRRSVPIKQLVAEFLASKIRKGVSKVHQDDLRNRFKIFCAKFGDVPTRILTQEHIEEWLDGLGLGPVSTNNYRARLFGLFRFGIRQKYMESNPCDNVDKKTVVHEEPEIYTPDQVEALLCAASPEILPLIAIGAFSGIRTQERVKLTWEDVDLRGGFITVRKKNSKTASRRTIKMEPNLVAWLLPYAGQTGRIFSSDVYRFVHLLRTAHREAGLTKPPQNGLRHSYASYHIAKYGDAEKIRGNMGHKTAGILFEHYRQLVRPEEAERYFNIFPPAQPGNIVPIAA